VSTWDLASASHVGLQDFCQVFAVAFDLKLGPFLQRSQIFAGDGLCGAASILHTLSTKSVERSFRISVMPSKVCKGIISSGLCSCDWLRIEGLFTMALGGKS